jgi:hypothetical protein
MRENFSRIAVPIGRSLAGLTCVLCACSQAGEPAGALIGEGWATTALPSLTRPALLSASGDAVPAIVSGHELTCEPRESERLNPREPSPRSQCSVVILANRSGPDGGWEGGTWRRVSGPPIGPDTPPAGADAEGGTFLLAWPLPGGGEADRGRLRVEVSSRLGMILDTSMVDLGAERVIWDATSRPRFKRSPEGVLMLPIVRTLPGSPHPSLEVVRSDLRGAAVLSVHPPVMTLLAAVEFLDERRLAVLGGGVGVRGEVADPVRPGVFIAVLDIETGVVLESFRVSAYSRNENIASPALLASPGGELLGAWTVSVERGSVLTPELRWTRMTSESPVLSESPAARLDSAFHISGVRMLELNGTPVMFYLRAEGPFPVGQISFRMWQGEQWSRRRDLPFDGVTSFDIATGLDGMVDVILSTAADPLGQLGEGAAARTLLVHVPIEAIMREAVR